MACIVKAPAGSTKGVVTFTTQERDRLFFKDPSLFNSLRNIKDRWVIGLHHNWHDWNFTYNDLFDFSLAGEEDLRERTGRPVPVITMDACNFSPECFRPGNVDKFWDVLNVSRAVFFKGIPQFFNSIRQLYDQGNRLRVLHICPVPPYDPNDKKTSLFNIREIYDDMFSQDEQNYFTLLSMDYRYPFPFDLPSLAHFYRSSKIYVHFTDDERRSRTAAYAWATGMPVVARDCVASLLTRDLRRPPYFFEAHTREDFAPRILEAVATVDAGGADPDPARRLVSATHTREDLISRLRAFYTERGWDFADSATALEHLDIRMGRHHGFNAGNNGVAQPMDEFVSYLRSASDERIAADLAHAKPEEVIAGPRDETRVSSPAVRTAREEPSSRLVASWNAFTPEHADGYLKTIGHPSQVSKAMLATVIRKHVAVERPHILDIGCGNAHVYEHFRGQGFSCRYTGVDCSQPLLDAAKRSLGEDPAATLIRADAETLEGVGGRYDLVLYSHVIEMLSSPELSLLNARALTDTILIRFFEPPDFATDAVELREMDVGSGSVPYLRRKMSNAYYMMILNKIGAKKVNRYGTGSDKDQIHVILF